MKKSVKAIIITASALFALIAIVICGFFLIIEPSINLLNAPDLDPAQLTSYSRTVTISDKYGNPLDGAVCADNKLYVRLDELPQHTIDAFIAIEDKRFYTHSGIDYKRIASAAISNIKSRRFREGASTITQQLIKNTHLSNEKTLKRKISEMRLARQLERVYDKKQILESYFNILYFGSGIKGLGTACRVMFDKSPSELTVAQSAALAAIINNPAKYSPYKNPDNLEHRKNVVLGKMRDQGYLSQQGYETAKSENIAFGKNRRGNQFLEGLLKNTCAELDCSEKELFLRNLTLRTEYDGKIAYAASELLDRHADIEGLMRILVLDNLSGGIVCDETNYDRFIDGRRSPASAIKPFVAYAPALENGYTPLSQIEDKPTKFGDYEPKNYRNVYRGFLSLKDALSFSSNIVAVKLLNDVGIDKARATADAFGLTLNENDDSSALALGGMKYGVTLTELANAYRTLANGGMYSDVHYIESVHTRDGICLQKSKSDLVRACGDDTAYLLTDMLMNCAQKGTAKKLSGIANIAAKTGTNGTDNGNTDCYCVAYTPKYTIAVWIGANEKPLDNKITGASCAKIIADLVDLCDLQSEKSFVMPQSVAYYEIDGLELRENHEVYLADPSLPKRYRLRELLSKRNLPIRKNVDIIDYFDGFIWENPYKFDFFDSLFGKNGDNS